jgi:hypothetical protein
MEQQASLSLDVTIPAAALTHLSLVSEVSLAPVLPAMEEPAAADILLLQFAAAGAT